MANSGSHVLPLLINKLKKKFCCLPRTHSYLLPLHLTISPPTSPTHHHLHPPSPITASSTQSLPLTTDVNYCYFFLHPYLCLTSPSPKIVKDIIIEVSDGLTIPFALVIGLSGANVTSFIILIVDVDEAIPKQRLILKCFSFID